MKAMNQLGYPPNQSQCGETNIQDSCSLSICIQGPRKYFHTFYLMVTPNQFCYKH